MPAFEASAAGKPQGETEISGRRTVGKLKKREISNMEDEDYSGLRQHSAIWNSAIHLLSNEEV